MSNSKLRGPLALSVSCLIFACNLPSEPGGEAPSVPSTTQAVVVPDTGATRFEPGGAVFDGATYVTYTGGGDQINVMRRGMGRSDWTKQVLNEQTGEGAALAVYDGHLYLAWVGSLGSDQLNVMRSRDGVTWTDKWTSGSISHRGTPALVVYGGKLNVFVNAEPSMQQYLFGPGGFEVGGATGFQAIGNPTLAVLGDRLSMVWQGFSNSLRMVGHTFRPGGGWTQDSFLVEAEGSIASAGDKFYMVARRASGQVSIYASNSNGQDYRVVADTTDRALGRPMAIRADADGVDYAFIGPDGQLNVRRHGAEASGGCVEGVNCPQPFIDWRMPKRTMSAAPGCAPQMMPGPAFISPPFWRVELSACGSNLQGSNISSYEWEITQPDGSVVHRSSGDCLIEMDVPTLGTYPARLTLVGPNGARFATTRDVEVKDYLVVSIGDSVASGEGNPDVRQGSPGGVQWQEARCHRSWLAGPAQAAIALEEMDPHSSVTFLSTACSGDGIYEGILGGNSTHPETSQLVQVIDRIGHRTPDATLVQVGGNDVGFGDFVRDCITPVVPPFKLEGCNTNDNQRTIEAAMEDLHMRRFPALRHELDVLRSGRVIIGDYFDPTHSQTGSACDNVVHDIGRAAHSGWVPDEPNGHITRDEFDFAYRNFILPLGNVIAHVADTFDWLPATGMSTSFKEHGYCSSDSWVRNFEDSFSIQGDERGTMHPNEAGHRAYAERLLRQLRPMIEPTLNQATSAWNTPEGVTPSCR